MEAGHDYTWQSWHRPHHQIHHSPASTSYQLLQLFYNLYNSFQKYLRNLKFCSGVSNNLKQKEHKISLPIHQTALPL